MIAIQHSRRLAGFRFEAQAPPTPAVLPRMDIAVFVGFAAAGPLHCPVPVTSEARFLEVFGPDLPLARDPATGLIRRAYLAPTVRAFFGNGGRRCWVIRVADERVAERVQVGLPGLLRVPETGALQPAMVAARSVGAWFDALVVRPFLSVRAVKLERSDLLSPAGMRLTFLGAAFRDLSVGDVLRWRSYRSGQQGWVGFMPLLSRGSNSPGSVVFTAGAPRWFFQVGESFPAPGTPLTATRYEAGAGLAGDQGRWVEKPHAGWFEESAGAGRTGEAVRRSLLLQGVASPPDLVGQWLSVASAGESLWMYVREAFAEGRTGTGTARVEGELWRTGWEPDAAMVADARAWNVERVALDLRAQVGEQDPAVLTGLGLAPGHERVWTSLPSDEDRFRSETSSLANPVPALWLEADSPRFPVALADPVQAQDWFIPLGLDALGATGAVWKGAKTALEREGLAEYGPRLFVHESLAGATVDALADAADSLRRENNDARNPILLRGLHGAWPVEEASLLAVPDALHAGWERGVASNSVEPGPSPKWERPGQGSFLDCARRVPSAPRLELVGKPDPAGTFRLRWSTGTDPWACYVLEEARQSDWSDAIVLWVGLAPAGTPPGAFVERVVRGRAVGDYYYRVYAVAAWAESAEAQAETIEASVRAWLAGSEDALGLAREPLESPCRSTGWERSDYSNGVVVSVAALPPWEEIAPRFYNRTTWLVVGRAMARFCAARGDAVALLGLPGHARDQEALALQAELLSPHGLSFGIGTTGLSLPLGEREQAAWSYGAMYHPWLVGAVEAGSWAASPPLGAVAGMIAARALERGAWIAPANQPLRNVLALAPDIPLRSRQEFLDRQLNLVRAEPGGILVLSQDTLSFDLEAGDAPLRPLNVRRLLILLRRLVLRLGMGFVFEPHGANLRARVRHSFEAVLSTLQVRGAFAGKTAAESFQVECGDDLNPPSRMEAGQLVVQIKVAPSRPMAFLTIRLVQTGERGRVQELL